MTKRFFLLCCFLMLYCAAQGQTALYVDSSRVSSGTGGSWAGAFKTLNEALNVANGGSAATYIIHIARGTYYPIGAQSGTKDDSVFLIARSGMRLLGGYPSGGGMRNPALYPSILSGNIGSISINTDNTLHILVIAGIAGSPDSIVVDGISVMNGCATVRSSNIRQSIYNGTYISPVNGGGVAIKKVGCPLLLNNCLFRDDSVSNLGGAIYNEAAATVISNCTFIRASASARGGGLYILADSNIAPVTVTDCSFNSNGASQGAGIYISRSGAPGPGTNISHCRFTGNVYPALYGGAITDNAANSSASNIWGCSFSNNRAVYGGAVAWINGAAATSALSYIRNCSFGNNYADSLGGALFLSSSSNTFAVDSCDFSANRAGRRGGGLYCSTNIPAGSCRVSFCTFLNDSAAIGGGVFNQGATPFLHCRFSSNKAVDGGGMYNIYPGNTRMYADTFSGNVAGRGGGLFLHLALPNLSTVDTLSNCLFSGNLAAAGGALYDSLAQPLIENCTFAGDTAALGNGIYNISSLPTIINCIIWEGSNSVYNVPGSPLAQIRYSTVQGGYSGSGNISANPLFIAPMSAGLAPTTAGIYELIPCSPAVDAGFNTNSYAGLKDLAGNARLLGIFVDQGAYEYSGAAFPTPISGRTNVCLGDTLQLKNLTTGGIWTSSDTTVARVTGSGIVTAVSVGIDTIIYTVTAGTCTGSAKLAISVSAPPAVPVINGPGQLCLNDVRTMSNAMPGGIWKSSDSGVVRIDPTTGLLKAAGEGLAIIYYTVTTGNCTGQVLRNVTVEALDLNITQNGRDLSVGESGASWQWIGCDNGLPITGATAQTFTAPANGRYAVIVSKNGCSDTSACATVTGLAAGTINGPDQTVIVFPNPASGEIHITTNNAVAGMIVIRDMEGWELMRIIPTGTRSSISLAGWVAGVYAIEVWVNGVRYRERLIVAY